MPAADIMSCSLGWNGYPLDLGQFVVTVEPVAVMGDGANGPLPKRAVQTNPYSAGRGSRRSRPMVGRKRIPEGWRMMMRKTSLILLGAAAGVAVTLISTQPRIVLNGARAQTAADTYRQLSLFGHVFERVRADHVDKPNDGK